MATTTIPWGDGSGDNIYLTYPSASGNQTVNVTSDANKGAERTKIVNFAVGNILKQLTVVQEAVESETKDFLLSSYDSVDKSYYAITSPANAYTDVDSDSVCGINMKRGASAETWVYFKFDTSSIPENAIIKSIVCQAKLGKQSANTNYIASANAVLCSGTTVKSAPVSLNASARVETFQDSGWSRSELNDIRIKIYGTRGTSNTSNSYALRIYGAKLTVEWYV